MFAQFKIESYICTIKQTLLTIKKKQVTMEKMSEYILRILKSGDIYVFFSWGPSNFQVLHDEYGNDMGIKFLVNGHHHKGYVEVFYDRGYDLFKITLKTKKGETNEVIEQVYFDELKYIIDRKIEYIEEYNH